MAGEKRGSEKSNGHTKLDEAMTSLVQAHAALAQAQAVLAQSHAAFLAEKAVSDQRFAELGREFNRIEKERMELERANAKERMESERANAERFDRIEAILLEHNRILSALPEQLREKIGFKAPS